MHSLVELQKVLQDLDLIGTIDGWEQRLSVAIKDERVRSILDLETPTITDLSEVFDTPGRILAIRMDLNREVKNHKKPVIALLILKGIICGKIPSEKIATLIDGGNYNSARAMSFYAHRFDMKSIYVMSRLFPQNIIDILKQSGLEVIQAPRKYENAREREFYEYLRDLVRDHEFCSSKQGLYCTWHARDGGKALYPLGCEIAKQLEVVPDIVISCLGAGTTLEGVQIAIQNYFSEIGGKVPEIMVAEHELSPLFAKRMPELVSPPSQHLGKVLEDFYTTVPELPHTVIGPHYDEINPLLSEKSIARITGIVQYSQDGWKYVHQELLRKGLSVGNSSAANISAAIQLARDGKTVLTEIFEPFWQFYYDPNH